MKRMIGNLPAMSVEELIFLKRTARYSIFSRIYCFSREADSMIRGFLIWATSERGFRS
jgi:hypothetical protein